MSNFVICWSIWIIFWYLCFSFHLISMWRTIKSINWPHKKKDMRLMCAPGSLMSSFEEADISERVVSRESQSVTADGIMLRHIIFPAKAWHYYDSVYHSCFMSHELCRKAVPLSWKCISSSCYRSLACRHEPYIRFPAKVWHAYASVYHSCFMSHELCRKAVPLSWQCLRSGMTRTKSHKCVALQLKQVESLAKNI